MNIDAKVLEKILANPITKNTSRLQGIYPSMQGSLVQHSNINLYNPSCQQTKEESWKKKKKHLQNQHFLHGYNSGFYS